MRRKIAVKLAFIICCTVGAQGAANDMEPRRGFFWGGTLGAGYLEETLDSTPGVEQGDLRFYLDGFGGYAINPHVAIGLDLGGWLIEADSDTYTWNPYWPPDNKRSDNPSGEGIEKITAFTRLYPYRDKGLFLKLGGGYLNHWSKSEYGVVNNDNGWIAEVGAGWDVHWSGSWSFTPAISFSHGEADHETIQAATLSISILWHQWKGPRRFEP